MAVLQALRRTPGVVTDNPVLFVPLAAYAVVQLPSLVAGTIDPILSTVLSLLLTVVFLFVGPFLYAGIVGMVDDAATGTPASLAGFWTHGRENYISVLGASLFVFAVTTGLGIAGFLVLIIGAVSLFGGVESLLALATIAVVGLLVALGYFVFVIAVHFYTHAIVIEGQNAVGGLKRSVLVVRRNLLAVVGYSVVSIVVGAVVGLAYSLLIQYGFPQPAEPGAPAPTPDLVPALISATGSVVLLTLLGTFFAVFSVLFYREVAVDDAPEAGDRATATDTAVEGAGDPTATD